MSELIHINDLMFRPPFLRKRWLKVELEREDAVELAEAIRETNELPGLKIVTGCGFVVRSHRRCRVIQLTGFGLNCLVESKRAVTLAISLARWGRELARVTGV